MYRLITLLCVHLLAMNGCKDQTSPSPSAETKSSNEVVSDFLNWCPDTNQDTQVREALVASITRQSLSSIEVTRVIQAIIEDDNCAAPGTAVWNAKYVDVLAALCGSSYRASADESLLRQIPFGVTAEWPATTPGGNWAAGEQSWALIEVRLFGAFCGVAAPAMRARIEHADTWVVRSASGGLYLPIPGMPIGENSVRIEVQVGTFGNRDEFEPWASRVVELTATMLALSDDEAIESTEIAKSLAERDWVNVSANATNGLVEMDLELDLSDIMSNPLVANLDLPLMVEVLSGGDVYGRLFFVGYNCEKMIVHPHALEQEWTIRITGTRWIPGAIVPRPEGSLKYWRGRIEIPIDLRASVQQASPDS